MPEMKCLTGNRCPECEGKLSVIVGVHGRQFCRKCKQPIVTNPNDDKFDSREWEYKGTDQHGNVMYGPTKSNLYTVDPRSKGSMTEHDIIEVGIGKGVMPYKPVELKEPGRKGFHCSYCGRGPCKSDVPVTFVNPERCLYMPGQEPEWIPDWVKPGAKCDYHSIIGEGVTTSDCTITSEIQEVGGTSCVQVDKVRGCVAIKALSEVKGQ